MSANKGNTNKKVAGRPCAREGCRGTAQHGSIYCAPHNPNTVKSGGAPTGNHNAFKHGLYSRFLTQQEQELIEAAGDEGLEQEIRVARINLARAVASGDTDKTNRALAVVKSLIAEHRKATGDQAAGITQAVATILEELGIGGDNPVGLN